MNSQISICENSFQVAWARVINELGKKSWDAWNVIVQIVKPELFDYDTNIMLEEFAKKNGLIAQKHVAHTIFPKTFFSIGTSRTRLYNKYWRFYNRPQKNSAMDGVPILDE